MLKRRQKLPDSLPYVPTFDTVCSRLSLPIEAKETLADAVHLAMESLMPFEEEAYTYSYEVVRERPETLDIFVAGAANETLAQCGHDALRAVGGLGKVRLDLSALGWARGIVAHWPQMGEGIRPVLVRAPKEVVFLLLSDGALLEVRGFPPETSDAVLTHAMTLALMRLAMEGGETGTLGRGLCLAGEAAEAEPLRQVMGGEADFEPLTDAEALLQQGLRARTEDAGAIFDLTPPAWIAEAKALRQKQMLIFGGAVFAVFWVLCAFALFFLPRYYQRQAEEIQAQVDAQHTDYLATMALRKQIDLVQAYGDRSQSALEMLLLICQSKHPNVVLKSFTYDRTKDYTIRVTGLADTTNDVYDLIKKLEADARIEKVDRGSQVASLDRASGRQAFTLTLHLPVPPPPEEEEEETP